MEINQKETAIKSYYSTDLETINARVLQYILDEKIVSNNDIQRDLGLTARQAGCARWHLMKHGKIRIAGTKTDPITFREVETIEFNPDPFILFKKVSSKQKIELLKKLCADNTSILITQKVIDIINL